MSSPRISVCVPHYNQGAFLEQAVHSALAQTWHDLEVVVVDDASPTGALDGLKRFGDERLRLFRNERNLGRAANINHALSLARGEYVTILPSDGFLLPGSLERRVRILEERPAVVLVYSGVRFVDEHGRRLDEHRPFGRGYVRSGQEEFRDLVRGNYIYPIAALMRRACVESVGRLDVAAAPSNRDWLLFLRMTMRGDVAYTPEVLVAERRHPGNFSEKFPEVAHLASYLILRNLFEELKQAQSGLAGLERRAMKGLAITALKAAGIALARSDVGMARRHVGQSVTDYPGIIWHPYFLLLALLSALPFSLVGWLPAGRLEAWGRRVLGLRERLAARKRPDRR